MKGSRHELVIGHYSDLATDFGQSYLYPDSPEFKPPAQWNAFLQARSSQGKAEQTLCMAGRNYAGLSLAGYDFRRVSFAYAQFSSCRIVPTGGFLTSANPAGARFEGADLEGTEWGYGTRFDRTRFDLKTSFLGAVLSACDFSRIKGTLSAEQLAVAKIDRIKLPTSVKAEDIVHAASLVLRRKPPRSHDELAQSRYQEEVANARAIVLNSACLSPPGS